MIISADRTHASGSFKGHSTHDRTGTLRPDSAPDFPYVFYGEHALAGERPTVEAMSP
jgi:hypothetical protein